MVKVKDNGRHGVVEVLDINGVTMMKICVQEEKRRMHPSSRTMTLDIRDADIRANMNTMVAIMEKRNIYPGSELPGKIVYKYSITPPDGSDPESYFLWLEGKVKRTAKGEAIYRFPYYSEDPFATDETCPE